MSGQTLDGAVEIDEVFLGKGQGRAATPGAFIAVEKSRSGRAIAIPQNSFTKAVCSRLAQRTIAASSKVLTDGWAGYGDLAQLGYRHQIVSSYEELPQVHSAIAHLRRYLAVYVRPPKAEYLPLYLAHWAWLYSHRSLTPARRQEEFLRLAMKGRVLS